MAFRQIGTFVKPISEKNKNGDFTEVLGVSIDKEFMPSVANTIGTDLTKYNVLRKNRFAFNPMHVGRDKKLPIAVYHEDDPALVSPAYNMFEVTDDNVEIKYLMLLFKTSIFDHLCWFYTDGSVRGGLSWNDFCNIELDIPSIDEQKKTLKKYNILKTNIEKLINENIMLERLANKILYQTINNKNPNGYFSDIVNDVIGGDWGKEVLENSYNVETICIRGADFNNFNYGIIKDAPIRYILTKNYENKKIQEGDLIIEISGGSPTQSTGRIALATNKNLHNKKTICSNFCRVLKVKEEYKYYAYELWKKIYNDGLMFSYENGTSGLKNFEIKKFIDNVPIFIPEKNVVSSVNEKIKIIYQHIHNNGLIIEQLQSLIKYIYEKG